MKFVSSTKIVVRSGKGGDGIIAWKRESRVRFGGPAGGSGGKGGSVYIEADENLNSLFHLRHVRFFSAKRGENGRNKSQNGKNAEDLTLKVPCGTSVWDVLSNKKLVDLISNGDRFLICKGGLGGRGNASFKSSKKTTPYLYEFGDPWEEKEIFLNLEFISDVGFLGKPNAGKSSLLTAISNAKPKISDVPFTTLIPVLGLVTYKDKKLVFADIPGLIKDSHLGSGLGIEFLKHINRCRVLVHLVDASSDSVIEDLEMIENEIKNYSESLYLKPKLLVFNKLDLISKEKIFEIRSRIKNRPCIFISTITKENIEEFISSVFSLYESSALSEFQPEIDFLEIKDDENIFRKIEISRKTDIWMVDHPSLKYWVGKIPKDTLDNISRLSQKIDKLGVNKLLFEMGAKKGEIVSVCGWEYTFLGS